MRVAEQPAKGGVGAAEIVDEPTVGGGVLELVGNAGATAGQQQVGRRRRSGALERGHAGRCSSSTKVLARGAVMGYKECESREAPWPEGGANENAYADYTHPSRASLSTASGSLAPQQITGG